jgi:hypothetical protein
MQTITIVTRAAPGFTRLPALGEVNTPTLTGRPPDPDGSHYDAMLLVASLEDLLAQRQSIEWLVEADLLWRCMA